MWIELIVFLAAPFAGVLMDRVYFELMIHTIHGHFSYPRKYRWSEFISIRFIFIVTSSIGIAYAGLNNNLTVGLLSAVIFLSAHSFIYWKIFRLEREERKAREE